MSNKPDRVLYYTTPDGVTRLCDRAPRLRNGVEPAILTYGGNPAYWSPNSVFNATMEFLPDTTFAVMDVATRIRYVIFPSDVAKYIQLNLIHGAQISGNWQVVKRNTAYGIQLIL